MKPHVGDGVVAGMGMEELSVNIDSAFRVVYFPGSMSYSVLVRKCVYLQAQFQRLLCSAIASVLCACTLEGFPNREPLFGINSPCASWEPTNQFSISMVRTNWRRRLAV